MLIRCPLCGHGRAIQPIRSAGITFKICFECVALAYDLGVKESLRDGSGRRKGLKIPEQEAVPVRVRPQAPTKKGDNK
jgi:hypothetical protein